MKKTFQIHIPLPREDAFNLLCTSGKTILSWSNSSMDLKHGHIEWKQSIWSFTGSAVIIARLEQTSESQTSVLIDILKPFQLIDPFFICDKIFAKLDKAWQKNIKAEP